MSTALDARIDELLGDEHVPADAGCPVLLEMSEAMAATVADSLRSVLYGPALTKEGRRALVVVLDSITLAFAGHEEHA